MIWICKTSTGRHRGRPCRRRSYGREKFFRTSRQPWSNLTVPVLSGRHRHRAQPRTTVRRSGGRCFPISIILRERRKAVDLSHRIDLHSLGRPTPPPYLIRNRLSAPRSTVDIFFLDRLPNGRGDPSQRRQDQVFFPIRDLPDRAWRTSVHFSTTLGRSFFSDV